MSILATMFVGCSDNTLFEETTVHEQSMRQVEFDVFAPAISSPSVSRAVSFTPETDGVIHEYVLLVFDGKGDNATYVRTIEKDSKDEDGNNIIRMIENQDGTRKMFLLLPEKTTSTTLVMLANINDKVEALTLSDTSKKSDVLSSLEYQLSEELNFMPMYGEIILPNITLGVKGEIRLKRAMARVVINAQPAFDHFQLQSVEIININAGGKVCSGELQSQDNGGNIINSTTGEINVTVEKQEDNEYVLYIPEMTNVDNRKTSVIVKGNYRGQANRYYRMEFIGQSSLTHITEIKRNFSYKFVINHMTTQGHSSRGLAISNAAANLVPGTPGVIEIRDEDIMNITTDRFYYFGITTEETLTASSNDEYYFVEFWAKGDNPNGWYTLPEELSLGDDKSISVVPATYNEGTDDSFAPGNLTHVWIYIPKTAVSSGQEYKIYIYSGNIRKVVTVKIP